MGFFDKFKKQDKKIEVLVPINGRVINISEIPDPVFSGKMMGDGFGVDPIDGRVYSPVSGTIANVFPTLHAIGITVNEDIDMIIHFGLDTVTLKGEGFTCHVKEGDTVKAGDLLLEVDIDAVRPLVPSLVTPVVFPKLEGYTLDVKYGDYNAKDSGVIELV